MGKLKEEELARLKAVQDADDDDLELDITKRRRLHDSPSKGSHQGHNTTDGEPEPTDA